MNEHSRVADGYADESSFGFDGSWREFAPIAFTNLLLTIVTLGIYRFWATTRERRYLWSRTRFVDERLEWAGTGKELFLGFVLVMLLFGIPLVILQFAVQSLAIRGYPGWAAAVGLCAAAALFYLAGVARFRALRYRLSRTRWRGIRGGSDDQGLRYGLSYMWKTVVGMIPLGILVPWSMTSLWNQRMNAMSFGPYRFRAHADAGGLYARYFLFYLAPFVLFIGGMSFAAITGMAGYGMGGEEAGVVSAIIGVVIALLFFYLGLGLIAVAFYAKFYREVIGALDWGELTFSFTASTKDWVKLLLGDIALVVVTFGIGWIFLSYRHYKFAVTYLEAGGEIVLDELTQSTTRTARHGEGLLDAFDVGAI